MVYLLSVAWLKQELSNHKGGALAFPHLRRSFDNTNRPLQAMLRADLRNLVCICTHSAQELSQSGFVIDGPTPYDLGPRRVTLRLFCVFLYCLTSQEDVADVG